MLNSYKIASCRVYDSELGIRAYGRSDYVAVNFMNGVTEEGEYLASLYDLNGSFSLKCKNAKVILKNENCVSVVQGCQVSDRGRGRVQVVYKLLMTIQHYMGRP